MTRVRRGGLSLKPGKIGRVNCLRQQLLMPGERMDLDINGSVRLEALRERDMLRINAHMATFLTPVRWLMPDFPQYVTEGATTSVVKPMLAVEDLSRYGLGTSYSTPTGIWDIFQKSVLQIYNNWYKWPEDPDAATWQEDGNVAVPLSKTWSRCRYDFNPGSTSDYMVGAATQFDLRLLAETQGKFRSAMKRDILSFGRWMELVQQMYGMDGSREVDQVPMKISEVEVGVQPREIAATDGAGLGQFQSLYDFGVNHSIRQVTAPEHCVMTTMLVVRFASITESVMPLATNTVNYENTVADPEALAVAFPEDVRVEDVIPDNNATLLGYLPSGWRWRCDHDVIGPRVEAQDSFPFMEAPAIQSHGKDATRVKNAFRSSRFGDYLCDLYFHEESSQPLKGAMESYFSGMVDDAIGVKNTNAEFPHGGKML